MALVKTVKLRKYQFLDALRTAPADDGLGMLLLRLVGTFGESLYGKEHFDVVVLGDDPLVGLALALNAKRSGLTVLLVSDSLGRADWPTSGWGYDFAASTNFFDPETAQVLADHVEGLSGSDSYMKALSVLIAACSGGEQVSALCSDYLQTSEGHIRGAEHHTLFPLSRSYGHAPLLNPLWRMVRESLLNLRFNHAEIEFVSARQLYITTPASRYVDPRLATPVGLAAMDDEQSATNTRAELVRSALTLSLRAK